MKQENEKSAVYAWPAIPTLLARSVAEFGASIALVQRVNDTVRDITYTELYSRIQAAQRHLLELKLSAGERAVLWSENCEEWIEAYYAILSLGSVVVPVDPNMPTTEAAHLTERASAKLILYHEKLGDGAKTIADKYRIPAVSLSELNSESREDRPLVPQSYDVQPDHLAVIIFTSGTTGFSKGVMLSHANLTSDALGVIESFKIDARDNFHLLLPLHHAYSSTVNLLCALAGGARATLATSYKSRDIVDDIQACGVTMLIGVPHLYESLMNGILRNVKSAGIVKNIAFHSLFAISKICQSLGFAAGRSLFSTFRKKAGLTSLRVMVSGGAALRPLVNKFFLTLGIDLVQGYGLTETSPVLTVNPPEKNVVGTVGPPVSGVLLKIENPDADGIGEVCARGPMIMRGYFEDDTMTSEAIQDGWFHTGDAGKLDDSGYLSITGRIKNVIITAAGKNIYPEEVEAQLNQSPFVAESLVAGVHLKPGGGEELFALIVPDQAIIAERNTEGSKLDISHEINQVVRQYNEAAPSFRRVRGWAIREQEFQKSSTLKILRYRYKDAVAIAAREWLSKRPHAIHD